MNGMKQVVSLVVTVAFATSLVSPCWSQGTAPAATQTAPAAGASCFEQGSSAGKDYPTGGAFTTGLVSGVLLGLIGTGVAYVVQGEAQPAEASLATLPDPGCRMEYRTAYAKAAKKRKRSAALGGGLVGTGIAVAVLLASSSN